MKKNSHSYLSPFYIHLCIWIVYFFYENGALLIVAPDQVFLFSSALYFIFNAVVFYSNYYLLNFFGSKFRSLTKTALSIFLLLLFYISANYTLTMVLNQLHIVNTTVLRPIEVFFVMKFFRFIYLVSISYTYWLIMFKIKSERQMFEFDMERMEEIATLEKEKIKTELNYLRFQINPHFLFNTLSFIYTQVVKHSDKAAKSVMLLSDIMDYALVSHDHDGKVRLKDELCHVQNLVHIHQLRFNNKMNLVLDTPAISELQEIKIPPLMMITFVENIFKYGDLLDPLCPALIKISLSDGELSFVFQNKKKLNQPVRKSKNEEIGLTNIKQRLSYLYPKNCYALNITDESNWFTANLIINLLECKVV